MDAPQIIKRLKSHADSKNLEGMVRFGISPKNTLGVKIPVLRKLAKEIGKDHKLAKNLWDSQIHEARILASMIDDPKQVSEKQMDEWVACFDSWDVCDQVCANLFDKTPMAFEKAKEWSKNKKEFIKRGGFALMACLAWHDKNSADIKFIDLLPYIKEGSDDDRNFVKKAVNWALRQIGKRNKNLLKEAIKAAKDIEKINSKSAQWIAKDALRELSSKL